MSDATDLPSEDQPTGETTSVAAQTGGPTWPKKRFVPSSGQRIGNSVMKALALWGLVPHTYVMTTKGRKTGHLHSTPVTLVEQKDKQWLVAPYGPVPWVLNARAAGKVTLSRRGKTYMYAIQELPAAEAGPVLKSYLGIATATKPYFEVTKDSPVEEFIGEASRHPVFVLTRAND